jgi:hypothetical protein
MTCASHVSVAELSRQAVANGQTFASAALPRLAYTTARARHNQQEIEI